ncbi:MAG TPA: hypothetical protein VE890_04375 [Thermoguttaceae bacterium]|nr:hypothetical protein [Thermoguttaceae bacterium]
MSVIVKSEPRTVLPTAGPRGLPFAHLNLSRNPFGELELDQRAALAVVDIDRFVERLQRPGYAVQFLGDKGRGKTTHLLAIRQHFPEAPYLHIGEGERPRIPRGHPLMIDEIQRLPRWRRRWVFRRPVSFVIGTHEDVSAELVRAGFEVDTIEAAASIDDERLHEILNRRIRWARRTPGPIPCVTLETAGALIDRFGDDVRTIEWYLYEQFQGLREIHDV